VAILHNGIYTVLMGGNSTLPNIGKLMTLEHIRQAIASRASLIDFCSTDSGWKSMWNMASAPVYLYDNCALMILIIACLPQ